MFDGEDPRGDAGLGRYRPEVALPARGLPLPMLAAIAVVLALALFLWLDGRRRATLADAETPVARARIADLPPLHIPPPLQQIPPPPIPPPPIPVVIHQPPPGTPPAPPPLASAAPVPHALDPLPGEIPASPGNPGAIPPGGRGGGGSGLILDLTSGPGAGASGNSTTSALAGGDDTAHAILIRNRANTIPQGTVIAGVLETPLNSDRPGLARAIVARDARGFDGTRVLIPRGSRLIGEFRADTGQGLRRVLVTWTRLIRPDGVAIRIGSPATDALGGAGIAGSVNTHFLERFSSAVLQSALTIGVNIASQARAPSGAIYLGLPTQAAQFGQQLVPGGARPPTVKARAGQEIAVLVARDLDFGGTPAVR